TIFSRDWSSDVCSSDLSHDLAAVNIDDGKHIHESTEHGYVGNVRLPDLVGAVDLQVPEQIGKFIITLIRFTKILFGIDGFQVHRSEERRVGKVCGIGV